MGERPPTSSDVVAELNVPVPVPLPVTTTLYEVAPSVGAVQPRVMLVSAVAVAVRPVGVLGRVVAVVDRAGVELPLAFWLVRAKV